MIFSLGTRLLLAFGLGDRLARRFAWLPALVLAALLVWLVMTIAANWFEQSLDRAEETGAAAAVVAGHEQTLDQLGDANNAEQDLRSAGERDARRYADCLRDARDKRGCERFRPAGEWLVPGRPAYLLRARRGGRPGRSRQQVGQRRNRGRDTGP